MFDLSGISIFWHAWHFRSVGYSKLKCREIDFFSWTIKLMFLFIFFRKVFWILFTQQYREMPVSRLVDSISILYMPQPWYKTNCACNLYFANNRILHLFNITNSKYLIEKNKGTSIYPDSDSNKHSNIRWRKGLLIYSLWYNKILWRKLSIVSFTIESDVS
jgi:hypothetical protein